MQCIHGLCKQCKSVRMHYELYTHTTAVLVPFCCATPNYTSLTKHCNRQMFGAIGIFSVIRSFYLPLEQYNGIPYGQNVIQANLYGFTE